MSKRARITLNLDPEPESGPATTGKPEVEPKPESIPKAATAAKPKPKPKAKAKPKARPKSEPKPDEAPTTRSEPKSTSEPKPINTAAAEPKPKPEPISEPARVAAAKPKPKPEPPGQTGAGSSPGEARIQSEPPTAAKPHFEPVAAAGGGLKLGTVIKVALVGLVVVSAILWLKRKP